MTLHCLIIQECANVKTLFLFISHNLHISAKGCTSNRHLFTIQYVLMTYQVFGDSTFIL